ncbi:unnamed protein product [Chrysoparadoxa australica]
MSVSRHSFKEALLQAGRQAYFTRYKWYVFGIGALFTYGSLLCHEFIDVKYADNGLLSSFVYWHLPVCALLYCTVFVKFVLSLQMHQCYSYQIGQFAAAHFATFLILQSSLVAFAMRAGIIWFVLPAFLVIINDIMAYLCGCAFGRTPLLALSPKKTREGYVGAALCTVMAGWGLGRWWGGKAWMTEPRNVFLLKVMNDFSPQHLFDPSIALLGGALIISKAELHAMGLALIIGLVGPFGGFFASGLKRAYGVKDFGRSIPGHGGALDRFDVQIFILPLVYFYMRAFVPELKI